ncbi:DUF2628 domain-containing protein [Starkeya sp. ORNL1]|uniref:DUF2628 domain-containing protein n=1 Tax=Starkeya sp. ORNL1 TaxID=2709380 RepID=UPI00146423B8|nr:DUF2628 domain-containing protein [Starkeya sp. ORNL1]QJP15493.1 DUF2628 domain-containing protein [Starkeya sp. ORNL1]
MAVWTVFEPDEAKDGAAPTLAQWAERVVFVREKFSWLSILFAPLVLLRYRLWLALIVYIVLQGLIGFALNALELDGPAGLLFLLPNLLVALMLSDLRRAKLSWRGYEELGAVVAPDRESAERRFFEGWLSTTPTAASAIAFSAPIQAPTGTTSMAPNPVLGLFPEARGR